MITKIVLVSFFSIVTTLSSYLINNSGQCCDQILMYGWPFPFYGGSGGFAGIQEDKILTDGLLKDLFFWFLIGFILSWILSIFFRKKTG